MISFFLNDKKNILYVLFFSFVLALAYHYLVEHKAFVELNVETNARTIFKIYWKKADGNWTERRVAPLVIDKEHQTYSFSIGDLGKIAALRIDTTEHLAEVKIKSIILKQNGYQPLRVDSKAAYEQIRAIEGIKDLRVEEDGLVVIPANKDPQLLFDLPVMERQSTLLDESIHIAAIVVLVTLLVFFCHRLFPKYRFLPQMVLVVLVLVTVMAAISKYNQHPDEFVHIFAGEYYQQHFMPPPVGEAPQETYSSYGVSRLHSGEIAYLFAGKFANLLQAWHLPSYLTFRTFNVALLALLLLLAINNRDFRILLLPLLLSPQIWYIFSYFNSEAYAVCIMLLVAYQMASPASALNRLLASHGSPDHAWLTILGLGLLLGMLLLLKMNFYFYCLFLFCYFVWRVLTGKTTLNRTNVVRLCLIAAVGLTFFACIRLPDAYINNFQKSAKLLEAREKYALDMFKPSTPLEKKHIHLQMKDRGVPLLKFIHRDRWGEKSFRTAFGVYGYTTISATFTYYDYVRYTGLLLLLTVVGTVLARGGWEGVTLLGITGGCAVGLMALALYHAWSVDFQAQGRYFLPIVGMLSIFFFHTERYLMRPLFVLLFLGMYLLSVYNFLFVGLYEISKYSFTGC